MTIERFQWWCGKTENEGWRREIEKQGRRDKEAFMVEGMGKGGDHGVIVGGGGWIMDKYEMKL